MLTRLRSLWRVFRSRRSFEEGMAEELRFHIDQRAEDLERTGLSPEEAARRARIEFGSMGEAEEGCRQARGLQPIDEIRRQVRHATRSLRRTPGFTSAALLTLAVCLGANLTIFAVIDSILLRPLPFPQADRLVTIYNTYPKAGVLRDGSSIANYYDRRGRVPAFSSLALYQPDMAIVGEPGSGERVRAVRVTPDFFETVGVGPARGRGFVEGETASGEDRVAVLTDTFWRIRFDADPDVVGRQVRVDGNERTIVGVLPKDFRFLSFQAQLFLPLSSRPSQRGPDQRHSGGNVRQMIGRLKPGISVAQAQGQIDALNAALAVDDPKPELNAETGFRSVVAPLHADHVASIRPTLLSLQTGALALLLIGAVNLVNLLLIRASGRVKETAVRQVLGASRRRVVSEALIEACVLSLLGGSLGLAVGAVGISLLSRLGAERLPLGVYISGGAGLVWAALAGAVVLGLALAIPTACTSLRANLASAIQSEARGGTPNRTALRLRHGFIVTQIGLSVALLTGAGLLGLSLGRAMAVQPGFQPDHVLSAQFQTPWARYPDWRARSSLNQRLLREIQRQPGVLSAGVASNVPLSGNSGKSAATVKGYVRRPGESLRGHYSYGVDGAYFQAMGFELVAGRFLTADDSRVPEHVCVVDDDFAKYYWPGSSPLGKLLFQGSEEGRDDEALTVVGVVRSAKQAALTDDAAQGAVYYPYPFRTDDTVYIVIRGTLAPDALAASLRTAVRRVDPELPIDDVRSMEDRIADSLVAERAAALLSSLFSAIAALLTAVGAYGVLSYAVAQRRREIGVRIALGACPAQIGRHFLHVAVRLLVAGVSLGVVGATLAGRALRGILFHVPPFHPGTIVSATAVIVAVSLVAALMPARRAARISPVEALSEE